MESPPHDALPRGQIRLLRLTRANYDNIPEGSLETYGINEAPRYVALSYTWDLPDEAPGRETYGTIELQQSGSTFIRWNLFTALQTIQAGLHMNGFEYVWADALCINQLDAEEKATHIPMMAQIFERAVHTLIWLGDGTPEEVAALQRIVIMERRCDELEKSLPGTSNWFELLSSLRPLVPPADDPFWAAFMEIIARPWFNRVWTVQEICMSTSASIRIREDGVMSWNRFSAFIRMIRSVRSDRVAFDYDIRRWRPSKAAQMSMAHRLTRRYDLDLGKLQGSPSHLLHQLNRRVTDVLAGIHQLGEYSAARFKPSTPVARHTLFAVLRGRECKLLEDRVYSILGLLSPDLRLTVDPTRQPKEVFLDAARHWWLHDPELTFLHWRQVPSVSDWLPSWALDLRFLHHCPVVWSGVEDEGAFNAGFIDEIGATMHPDSPRNESRQQCFCPHLADELVDWRLENVHFGHKGSLRTRAMFIGEVKRLEDSPMFDYAALTDLLKGGQDARSQEVKRTMDNANSWLLAFEEFAEDVLGPSYHDAYCRTLVQNRRGYHANHGQATDKHMEDDRSKSYRSVIAAFCSSSANDLAALQGDARAYSQDIASCMSLAIFGTSDGRIGRAMDCQVGDIVVIFPGARTPFVLRPVNEDCYRIVAEAYLHGVMHGEAFCDERYSRLRTYTII